MRNYITGTFTFILILTSIITLLVGIAWLFDCKPNNLYLVWKYSYNSLTVSFLFYILFGGKKE